MSDPLTFNRKTAEVERNYMPSPTPPLVAIGWLAFTILLLISPALVWAGWRWLT